MKRFVITLLSLSLFLNAAPETQEQGRKALLDKFDTDSDGRLSKLELEAMRTQFDKEGKSRRQDKLGKRKFNPTSSIDESFLKAEVVSMPSSLISEIKTLQNKFVIFKQVQQKGKAPLIVYLHGGGGDKGGAARHLNNPTGRLISKGKHPFNLLIPVFKKTHDGVNGWNPDDLSRLLKFVIKEYNIDASRVFVTGHSMGGAGSFMWGNQYPDLIAGLAPRSAGGASNPKGELPVEAKNYVKMPIWAFHGSKDRVCDHRKIEDLLNEVTKLGGKVKFTLIDGAGHNIASTVNQDDKLLKWFLSL